MESASGRPIVVQCGARHVRHFPRNFIGGHRDNADPTQRNDGQREGIFAGKNQEPFGHGTTDFRDLRYVAAGLLDPENIRHFR